MKMIRYNYDPSKSLVEIPGKVAGPRGDMNITLIYDPGSYRTILSSSVLDRLGYDTASSKGCVQTTSVTGVEKGALLRIDLLSFLNFSFDSIVVASFDLPQRYQIDGLIGLDLLEQFVVTLNHRERWIQFSRLL